MAALAEERERGLAAAVKSVHAHLRCMMNSEQTFICSSSVSTSLCAHVATCRDYISGGKSVDELWRNHVSDKDVLRAYSKAMRDLATGPWAGREDGDRISWCVQTCEEYGSHRLEQLVLKDLRRLGYDKSTLVQPSLLPTSQPAVRDMVVKLQSRTWRLLDVGSCYNPFLTWPQFVVTAIDIAPASEVISLSTSYLNSPPCLHFRVYWNVIF